MIWYNHHKEEDSEKGFSKGNPESQLSWGRETHISLLPAGYILLKNCIRFFPPLKKIAVGTVINFMINLRASQFFC